MGNEKKKLNSLLLFRNNALRKPEGIPAALQGYTGALTRAVFRLLSFFFHVLSLTLSLFCFTYRLVEVSPRNLFRPTTDNAMLIIFYDRFERKSNTFRSRKNFFEISTFLQPYLVTFLQNQIKLQKLLLMNLPKNRDLPFGKFPFSEILFRLLAERSISLSIHGLHLSSECYSCIYNFII